jgi:hypothetical protein
MTQIADEFIAALMESRRYRDPPISVRQRLFDARAAAQAVLTEAQYRAVVDRGHGLG